LITSELLGKTRVTKTIFENPDPTAIPSDKDYYGNSGSGENAVAGPFVDLGKGNISLKVCQTKPVSGNNLQLYNVKNICNNRQKD
jgi:hypothetical protein